MNMQVLGLGNKPIVKLFSVSSPEVRARNLRIIHFIRPAEGYHNINRDYKNPLHIDAELTPNGIAQCEILSTKLQQDDVSVDCIISSPMRRTLQTASFSFQHLIQNQTTSVPIVACEHWRETVNYLCDVRLTKSDLIKIFETYVAHIDFSAIEHEHDPIWKKYEKRYGSHDTFTKHRESDDDDHLTERSRLAWKFIADRPSQEKSIAVVSHSAFLMHVFTRLGLVQYQDEHVEELMTSSRFDNCEMRSVAFDVA